MREEYTSNPALAEMQDEPKLCDQCEAPFKHKTSDQRFCSFICYRRWRKIHGGSKPRKLEGVRQAQLRVVDDGFSGVPTGDDPKSDDALWTARAQYWEQETASPLAKRRNLHGGQTEPKPLVLAGHGVQLKVNHGALMVRNGFTHYPQVRQEWILFPGDWRSPSRIVMINPDGSLSLHVIKWLAQQGIPLIMLNWNGEVISEFGSNSAADLNLRQAQLAAIMNGKGLALAVQLIRSKIIESRNTLRTLSGVTSCAQALRKLDLALKDLGKPLENVNAVMMIEARAAADYFEVWKSVPLRWKAIGRHPIPSDWHFIGQRRSARSPDGRHATHPVNALLNYAYTVLESQLRIAAATVGLDLAIGYLHARRPGREALIYDLMEPLRPKVDRMILSFARSHTFTPKDFLLLENGVCRLHPQLARKVVELSLNDHETRQLIEQAITFLN